MLVAPSFSLANSLISADVLIVGANVTKTNRFQAFSFNFFI